MVDIGKMTDSLRGIVVDAVNKTLWVKSETENQLVKFEKIAM